MVKFVENGLFTTLTNVNFDPEVHINLLKKSQKIKEKLRKIFLLQKGEYPEHAIYNLSDSKDEMLKDAIKAGIMYDDSLDQDIRSLRSTILYGLKGIAYGHQARFINFIDKEVDNFYFKALEATTNDKLSSEDLIELTMKTGNIAIAVNEVIR